MNTSRLRSVLSSAAGVYSTQLVIFVTAAILSRLLDPEDFGILSILLMVNGFLCLFANAGISSVIVQFRELSKRDIRALWGLAMLIGILLAGSVNLGAPLIADYFQNSKVISVLKVGSIAIFLTPLLQITDGLFIKELRFGLRAISMFLAAILSGIIGVLMAISGFGYWALVAQMIVRPLVTLVISCSLLKIAPVPLWNYKLYKSIGGFALNLIGFRSLNYWTKNIDNFLIGRAMGMSTLGIYSRSYALQNMAILTIQSVVAPVLNASFSVDKDDIKKLYRDSTRVTQYVALASFTLMGFSSVLSGEITSLVWGPQWKDSAIPYSALAIGAMFTSNQPILGELLKARNKTFLLLMFGIVKLFIYATLIYFALEYDITGVAIAVAISGIVTWVLFNTLTYSSVFGESVSVWLGVYIPVFRIFSCLILALLSLVVLLEFFNITGFLKLSLCFIFYSFLLVLLIRSQMPDMYYAFLRRVRPGK